MLIDTHGHVQFNSFKDDSGQVVKRAFEAGVALVIPGTQKDTSRFAVEMAVRYDDPRVWAAIGLHPIHLEETRVDEDEVGSLEKFMTRNEEFNRENYEPLLKSEKVVAIGEIGLDYWRRPKSKAKREVYMQKQADTLVAQLDMAADHNLPVILHCRVAHDDMLEMVKANGHYKKVTPPGVVHSYTGDLKQLDEFLNLGFCIGVNGLVFKLDFVEAAVAACPLERILLETDAPYLTPKGAPEERNEPAFVKYTAQKIAEIKNVSVEEVERQTTENAKRVFKVDFGEIM